jgi:hypothetical protein
MKCPCLSKFFTVTVAAVAFAFTGCAPFGSIDDFIYDEFWVISTRPTYNKSDTLIRKDISVYASFQGSVDVIPVESVDISIEENPFTVNPVPQDGGYIFESYGKKRIIAKYRNMEAAYSIHVLNPNGNGNGNGGGPDTGSGGSLEGGNFIEW